MRGATQVGRCTLIGYYAKQSNWPIRTESKDGSQQQDPELQEQQDKRLGVRLGYLPLPPALASWTPFPHPHH